MMLNQSRKTINSNNSFQENFIKRKRHLCKMIFDGSFVPLMTKPTQTLGLPMLAVQQFQVETFHYTNVFG